MRKLASIQKIKYKKEIPNAEFIECVSVLGWECVSKKGEFKENDKCVYFEIDCLLPEIPIFEFLRKSCYRSDLKKFRLKTVKLKKQISQGLALPINLFPDLANLEVGTDVSDILDIEKYEPPVPAQIQGDARSFSWPISKTDEIRVQAYDNLISDLHGKPYYISLKLDGTSTTFLIDPRDNEYHVCGRNYSYKRNENHSFWQIDKKYQIEQKLREYNHKNNTFIALQGETVGQGIQKNKLGLNCIDFYVFNVVDIEKNNKIHIDQALEIVNQLNLKFVPIIERKEFFDYSQKCLLHMAKGKYFEHFPTSMKNQDREGVVIRSLCGKISFKAINNDFLLKENS